MTFAPDISWSIPSPPPNCRARIAWWGNPPGVYDEVLLGHTDDGGGGKRVVFPLRSSEKHVKKYLRDIGTLNITVLEGEDAPKVIADAPLGLSMLAGDSAFAADVPFFCRRTKRCVGTINIRATTEYVGDLLKHHDAATGARTIGSVSPTFPLKATASSSPVEELATPEVDDLLPQDAQQLSTNDSADMLPPSCNASPHAVYSVFVTIESAFQLPPPDQTSVYISAAWQGDRSRKVLTPKTAVHDVPSLGRTAVWHHTVEVGIPLEEFEKAAMAVHNNEPGASSSSTLGIMDGPLLLLHVWRCGRGKIVDVGGPAEVRPTTEPTPFDALIGCAALDLSALVEHSLLHSRYPIVSARHEVCGAVKAMVEPSEDLAVALNALWPSRAGENLSAVPPVRTAEKAAHEGPSGSAILDANVVLGHAASSEKGSALVLPAAVPRTVPIVPNAHGGSPPLVHEISSEIESHREPQRNAQYAWSGSDSDDGDAMGMVGVAFEGAVSCSEDEDLDRQQAMPAPRLAPALIMEDWLFDITRRSGPPAGGEMQEVTKDEQEGGCDAEGEARQGMAEDGGNSVAPRRVIFKNSLLPGVVMTPARVRNVSSLAAEQSPAHIVRQGPVFVSSSSPVGPVSVHQPQASSSTGNDIATSEAPSTSTTCGVMPYSTLKDADWMFGIGRVTLGSPNAFDESAPRVVDQFLPTGSATTPSVTSVTRAPDGGLGESSTKGRHEGDTSGSRSPTLSEVLQGLRMQTDTNV